jgi:Domain of unknown function (DUF3291)
MSAYHLAQLNVARMLAPITSETMSGFVAQLAPINAMADTAPGFVWRLQTDEGDATGIRVFDDDAIIVNMSVWESVDALRAFVYRSAHVEIMRKRREWFAHMADAYLVLWWVQAGHRPTISEAIERLETLRRLGPSSRAFSFRSLHPPPTDVHLPDELRDGTSAPTTRIGGKGADGEPSGVV